MWTPTDGVRRPGPARDDADAGPAGELAVGLRHVGGARLVAAGDQADRACRAARRGARCSSRRGRRRRSRHPGWPAGRPAPCRRGGSQAVLEIDARALQLRLLRVGRIDVRDRPLPLPLDRAARARERTPSARVSDAAAKTGSGPVSYHHSNGPYSCGFPASRCGSGRAAARAGRGPGACAGRRRRPAGSRRGRSAAACSPAGRSVSSHTSARPATRPAPTYARSPSTS